MKTPAFPSLDDASAQAQAVGSAVGEMLKSVTGLSVPVDTLTKLQADYVAEATKLWNGALRVNRCNISAVFRIFSDVSFASRRMC